MRRLFKTAPAFLLAMASALAGAQTPAQVVDIPTRSGVTQRMLVLAPPAPKAAVVLLAGGHGGLQIQPDGTIAWGGGNFLVRSRELFAERGLLTVVLDAPSDRQRYPYLENFRESSAHVADLKAVIAWLHETAKLPVWLVGTSRGTQSAAYAAIELSEGGGPDGIVLTSTILTDTNRGPVPYMSVSRIKVPVLVVHHEQDGCRLCPYSEVPSLMKKLVNAPRKQVLAFTGGTPQGDPCEAWAYHGFNGVEREVVDKTVDWLLAP